MSTQLKFHGGPMRCAIKPTQSQHTLLNAHDKKPGQYWVVGETTLDNCWIYTDVLKIASTLGIPSFQLDEIIGDIEAYLDDAAEGNLTYGPQQCVKAVATQANLFEIAFDEPRPIKAKNYHLRLYFIEPPAQLFNGIVTLLFHVKPYGEHGRHEQNEYMRRAAMHGVGWQQEHASKH